MRKSAFPKEAKRRAWATEKKLSGGGNRDRARNLKSIERRF